MLLYWSLLLTSISLFLYTALKLLEEWLMPASCKIGQTYRLLLGLVQLLFEIFLIQNLVRGICNYLIVIG
jgi:hypothetical protein